MHNHSISMMLRSIINGLLMYEIQYILKKNNIKEWRD
jgi:hypothetical protein